MTLRGVVDVGRGVVRVREVRVAPAPQSPLDRVVRDPLLSGEAPNIHPETHDKTNDFYAGKVLHESHGQFSSNN